mmetsp:Transcript_12920/g.32758  ORF Transcript_12920/g.32758 Transcript_12920/m.32758 type:complete len:406 (-) Transcript_12920:39-1256(-)
MDCGISKALSLAPPALTASRAALPALSALSRPRLLAPARPRLTVALLVRELADARSLVHVDARVSLPPEQVVEHLEPLCFFGREVGAEVRVEFALGAARFARLVSKFAVEFAERGRRSLGGLQCRVCALETRGFVGCGRAHLGHTDGHGGGDGDGGAAGRGALGGAAVALLVEELTPTQVALRRGLHLERVGAGLVGRLGGDCPVERVPVNALVPVARHPFLLVLVVNHALAFLLHNALLLRELLPARDRLHLGHWLLARQRGRGSRQPDCHLAAVLLVERSPELVEEQLRAVARALGQPLLRPRLERCLIDGRRVEGAHGAQVVLEHVRPLHRVAHRAYLARLREQRACIDALLPVDHRGLFHGLARDRRERGGGASARRRLLLRARGDGSGRHRTGKRQADGA